MRLQDKILIVISIWGSATGIVIALVNNSSLLWLGAGLTITLLSAWLFTMILDINFSVKRFKLKNLKVAKLDERAKLPDFANGNSEDAGMDLYALEDYTIQPHSYKLIPTGIAVSIPEGFTGDIRPKSGLALNEGITVLNADGLVDPAYRGDVGVILINHSNEPFEVFQGDKIAQLVIGTYEQIEWNEVDVDELSETKRGKGGFGHTGRK